MQNALDQLWVALALYVPKIVLFLVILVIGWIVAKILGKAVDSILERVGFDRAVERGGVKRALAKSQYDASSIVGKLVYYTLILFVLQLAFGVFGPNPISDLLTRVIAFLPSIAVAIVIVVLAAAIATAVRELIANTIGGLSYGKVLANIAAAFILGLGIIAALNQVGIATTVTLPVLITVLATIGGILVVGVGGGLIKPMQARWESYLGTMESETQNIKDEAAKAPSVKQQAEMAKNKAQAAEARTRPTGGATSPDVPFDRNQG
ncbi:hypothetical protein M3697_08085 [Janibacter melonis]|uniref:mechanosensitive ion channel family protein n=1 Tax=Janibacter melonis TaxID=262209 RepID=UPI002044040F|nr:hypothetical protein [Janibacter melonis]MCM3555062.1 hypothetical protein [Janibacter melonis]